jgi:hypothetical protein
VVDHREPVSRQADVQFDCVGAQFNGPLKSSNRILGGVGRNAAVGNDLEVIHFVMAFISTACATMIDRVEASVS